MLRKASGEGQTSLCRHFSRCRVTFAEPLCFLHWDSLCWAGWRAGMGHTQSWPETARSRQWHGRCSIKATGQSCGQPLGTISPAGLPRETVHCPDLSPVSGRIEDPWASSRCWHPTGKHLQLATPWFLGQAYFFPGLCFLWLGLSWSVLYLIELQLGGCCKNPRLSLAFCQLWSAPPRNPLHSRQRV